MKKITFYLLLSLMLMSFKPKDGVEPITFHYTKMLILQQGSDNFAFDSKKVDTSSGEVYIIGKFVKIGKHKCRLKYQSDYIVVCVSYDKTYFIYK